MHCEIIKTYQLILSGLFLLILSLKALLKTLLVTQKSVKAFSVHVYCDIVVSCDYRWRGTSAVALTWMRLRTYNVSHAYTQVT